VINTSPTGGITQYILDGMVSSLTTNPALPTGVTLTWNLAATYGISGCPNPSAMQAAGITGCVALAPTQQSTQLTLTLTVLSTATVQSLSFNTVFQSYSTSTG
jgi:hypothetical protein